MKKNKLEKSKTEGRPKELDLALGADSSRWTWSKALRSLKMLGGQMSF